MDDPTMTLTSMLHTHSPTNNAMDAARMRRATSEFDAAAAAATLVSVPSSTMMVSDTDVGGVDVGLGTSDDGDDVADIAFAAEAASQALEANDAAVSQQQELEAALLTVEGPTPAATVTPTAATSNNNGKVGSPSAPMRCRICQQGESEGRPIIRFLAASHNDHRLTASTAGGGTLHPPPPPPPPGVSSFQEEIQLHVFCGKTASILPTVNQPDLEILTKAGLKNKHGIGPEVNAALARTRCAVIPNTGSSDATANASKEKQYYLVREFEAHLASIRHSHLNYQGHNEGTGGMGQPQDQQAQEHYSLQQLPQQHQPQEQQQLPQYLSHPGAPGAVPQHQQQHLAQSTNFYNHYPDPALDPTLQQLQLPPRQQQQQHYPPNNFVPQDPYSNNNHANNASMGNGSNHKSRRPTRAAAGQVAKPKGTRRKNRQEVAPMPLPQDNINSNNNDNIMSMSMDSSWSFRDPSQGEVLTPEGKVQCGCGGTHWPTGTTRGSSSWRNHVTTKKHQKWMEDNGMLGAV